MAVRRRRRPRGEAFNFAAGERLTVLEVVDRILRLMGSDLEPDVRDRGGQRDPGAAGERREGARRCSAGGRAHSLDDGLWPTRSTGTAAYLSERV